ncbi:MAG: hypothetical protein M3144_04515, partial [Actinomycetota bacterium]|nr:hypothetical protein [Actinomycetota bacterium]
MESALSRPVDAFVTDLAPVLVRLGEEMKVARPQKLLDDVALEAFNLAAAFVDADGVHTEAELWAFVVVFGPRFDTVARAASPPALRASGLLTGRRTFLDAPSALFDLLVRADVRAGTTHSWTYYLDSLNIAHLIASLDKQPSHAELTAIERFRSMLLRTMDDAGVGRPGARRPVAGAVVK